MYKFWPVAQKASNLRGGVNPPFDLEDFKKIYPHFWGTEESLVPQEVMLMFLEFAHSCVKESRYHGAWRHMISLFIAHFLTLYLQSAVDPENVTAGAVIGAGQAKGLQASKSVDGVSVSYDFSIASTDLDGWAAWKSTTYGTQFATLAKMYGKGGMYVW